jgi:copper chaperone
MTDALMATIPSSDETREYTVAGMTCSHCVKAVRDATAALPGVRNVEIELPSGRMSVTASGLENHAIRDAVADAGYRIT